MLTSQRLSNLESALISIRNLLDSIATDTDVFTTSNQIETLLADTNDRLVALENQAAALLSELQLLEDQRDGKTK